MTKKLTPPILLLLGLLFSAINAVAETIGLKNDNSSNTVTAITPYTIDGIVVSMGNGTQKTANDKDRNLYWGSKNTATKFSKTTVTVSRSQSKDGTNITAISNDYWTGVSLNINNGKKFNLTSFCIDVAGDNINWKVKAEIINGDGTSLYKTEEQTINPCNDSKIQLKGESLNLSLTGNAYVKLYYCAVVGNSSKYIVIPALSITGTLEDNQQTNYTKPTFKQGDYDRASATYPVTIATQNDEAGVINYTIGDGDKVTNAASGIIVNVPVNTTVKATVSGDDYAESAEATFTTSDMPALDAPVQNIQAYDFAAQLYTVALTAAEGATIKYTVDGGAETDYTTPFTVAPKTEVKAYAVLENMKNSATLTFTTADAPTDGTHTTSQEATYTDGMVYDAGAYSIANNPGYIGGKVSSGNSSINGAIKMRISRAADPTDFADKYGFHLDVNKGYTINSVKLQMLNNYNSDISLTGVYADDATTNNLLAEAVTLPYASASSVAAATAEVTNIAATDRIVFTFDKNSGSDNPNQAQILITVTYTVPEYATVNSTVGYGTMYYEKELKVPADTKAYTAVLNGNTLTLNELTDGIIPAKTAVVVAGNGGLFEVSHTSATFDGKNDLQGTATEIETSSVTDGTVCVLGYENSKTAFYKYVGTTLAANKAYVVAPLTGAAASAKGINIVIGGNLTGISEVEAAQADDAPAYNLAGQRVAKDTKGIVIVNGKKYINK